MSTKTCSKCGVEKDVIEFWKNKNKNNKDGLQVWCKLCMNEDRKEKRDKIIAYAKDYRVEKRDKIIAYAKDYRVENREEILAKQKEYNKTNRDKILIKKKEYYKVNREEILAKHRTPEARAKRRTLEARVKANSRRKERLVSDPRYRIEKLLRDRLHQALKAQSTEKSTNTIDLLGCSPDFLLVRLQKQIKPGTRREDYHIDHIIPCALFDLTKEEDQRLCFHWTNLQLLLGPANQAKSDDVIWSGHVYKPDEVPSEIREEIYAHCRSNMTLRSS